MDSRPIGVFDSGFGGLSVLEALVEALPDENYIYLGDTARLPYGVKSPETVQKYLSQNIEFLARRGAKAIVIACNTASAVLNPANFQIPVLGVIEAGAKMAVNLTNNHRIGVLATRGTVASNTYVTSIHTHSPRTEVFQMASPLLVPLVEENWINDPVTNLIVYRYLQPLVQNQIDTLVLGCTHYPFLFESIRRVTGPQIEIVKSGPAVATELKAMLQGKGLESSVRQTNPIDLLTTDASPTYLAMARRLTKGLNLSKIEVVSL